MCHDLTWVAGFRVGRLGVSKSYTLTAGNRPAQMSSCAFKRMAQQHSPAKTMSSDPEHNDRSKLARGLNNRKLLDLVREAVLLVDLSGEIVFWNQGAEQLYGWNANEALGQSPLE